LLPQKHLWEISWIKNEIPVDHEWIDCDFHVDIEDAPKSFLQNEKSPITLYFAADHEDLKLDMIPDIKQKGRKAKPRSVTLNPGAILLFDTCTTMHRTAAPTTYCTPDRVNLCITGFEEYWEIEEGDGNWAK
jgi:hypothetical protein